MPLERSGPALVPLRPETPGAAARKAALPGEKTLNPNLLGRAVVEINRLYVTGGLDTARAIGRYLLRTFFADRVEDFEPRARTHVTFRALAESDDLQLSPSFLWYAVRFVHQEPLLPKAVARELPFTHHRLLLSIPDRGRKVALARRAVAERLTSRALAEEIRKARSIEPGAPARAARTPAEQACTLLARGARLLRDAVDPGDGSLDPARRRRLARTARRDLQPILDLVERLET